MESNQLERAATGCLLGMAVGDALGLPCEGLSTRRQQLLFPELRHSFFLGRGLVSDDTEHAVMTAQAFLRSRGDLACFASSLAWRLRWWLLGVPAGIGLATLRGVLRLWAGFPPDRSGVHSAGNGPCMRAPILGVVLADDPERCRAFVTASTRLTHTHPDALDAAWIVAIAAAESARAGSAPDPSVLADALPESSPLNSLLARTVESVGRGESTVEFARTLGLVGGVTGYCLHTVPVAIHAWLTHPKDYEAAVSSVIRCGGDTDTVAAITGGIVGAAVGVDGIPKAWREGLAEWPCGVPWMHALGVRLVEAGPDSTPQSFNLPWQLIRNLFFVLVVLFHGFRRLLPPY